MLYCEVLIRTETALDDLRAHGVEITFEEDR
jgi:hypothetical protein